MSEPVIVEHGKSRQPGQWPALLKKIVSIIRQHDASRWLVVSPGSWGGPKGYKSFQRIESPRIIYGAHMYAPHRFTHQGIRNITIGEKHPGRIGFKHWNKESLKNALAPLHEFQRKWGAPVIIGEFGAVRWAEGGEQYIQDLAAIFNDLDWSWLYFSGTGWHGWNPNYNQEPPSKGRLGSHKESFVGTTSTRWETLRKIFTQKSDGTFE